MGRPAGILGAGRSSLSDMGVDMELRQLRYFVAVAETLHFARAAEQLHVSQPPVTRQIRQLEDELGVSLFERSTQKVALTEAGRVFLPEARAVLAQAERAMRAARAVARGEEQRLEVGYLVTLDHGPVAQIIAAFRAAHPTVAIGLTHLTSLEQIAALRDGRIDVGFVRLPVAHRGLECRAVGRDPFVVVLPQGHRLARKRRVDLAALRDDPFVMIEARMHPTFHAITLDVCRTAGFSPRVVHESERLQNLVVMVASGLGVALVPRSVAAFRSPGAVFKPLIGEPGEVAVESGVLCRPRDGLPLVGAFMACVDAFLADSVDRPGAKAPQP